MSGLIRDLSALVPEMEIRARELIVKLHERDIQHFVYETRRSPEVQEAYFAQGRKPLDVVNALRKQAGLWLISEVENKKKITWTTMSNHIRGRAIDIVLSRDGRILWSAPFADWEQMGRLGEQIGLIWGGRWEPRDCPHFELPAGTPDLIVPGWRDVGAGG